MTTLIIGGGLSGLALADLLHARGQDFMLLEARDRFGGRIKTQSHNGAAFDLGPAWFWPGQPRVAALVARFGLRRFDQHSHGALMFEDEAGQVHHGRGMASMEGSWRIAGGFGALTDALAATLPDASKRLNAPVKSLSKTSTGVEATLDGGETIAATRAVLALPPRIAATFGYTPALPDAAITAMQAVPTWMAGQAKIVATYDHAFWRDAGQSGDATSRHGPLVEIHDASAFEGGAALFGFVGVPPAARTDIAALKAATIAQLTRLFGRKAADPTHLWLKDWAFDPRTATPLDAQPLYAHPTYAVPPALTGLWGGAVSFAGTEVAPRFGGYLEGALEAAEAACASL